ncbi:MAG: DUF58 domain-containing protein, partial [Bacteroidia bacterium]
QALKFLTNAIKKRSIAFVISDFIDTGFEDAVKIANKKHDIVALRIYDRAEIQIPKIGLIKLKDNETGKIKWVDTSSDSFQKELKIQQLKTENKLKDTFSRAGVDFAKISTEEGYVKPLMNLLKRRA